MKNNQLSQINVKGEKGFSLIELMVVAALSGILSLGVLQTIQNATNISYKSAQKVEVFQIVNQIKATLQNKEKCQQVLFNRNPVVGEKISKIGRIEGKKFYGAGGARVKLDSMTIKKFNKETSMSTLEIIFHKPVGKNKKPAIITRNIFINTNLYPQDVPEAQRGNPQKIKDCLTDTDTYQRNSCEDIFEGNFSDQKKCKSITVEAASSSKPAITAVGSVLVEKNVNLNQEGNIDISGGVKANNQVTEESFTIKQDTEIGIQNKIKITLKPDISTLKMMGFVSKLQKVNMNLQNSKKVAFSVSKNNLIIDGHDQFDRAIIKTSHQDKVEPNLSNQKGIIATRYWTYQTLANLLTKDKKDILNNYIKDTINKIQSENGSNNGPQPGEKSIVKSFAQHICQKYFKSFKWDGDNCIPNTTCETDQLLTIKNDGGTPKLTCVNIPNMKCVNIDHTAVKSGTGKCYNCGEDATAPSSCY
jgi:prepilin-type N-terminal cleavage/methylation domain-containing protein